MFNWVQQRNRNAIFLRHRAANQVTALLISFKMALLNTHKRVLLCNTIWTGKSNIVNVLLYKLLRWQGQQCLSLPCMSHTLSKDKDWCPFLLYSACICTSSGIVLLLMYSTPMGSPPISKAPGPTWHPHGEVWRRGGWREAQPHLVWWCFRGVLHSPFWQPPVTEEHGVA